MAADGQVLIETKIDSSGMEAGAKEIVAAMKDLTTTMKGFAESFNSSFEKVGAPAGKAKKSVDEVTDSMSAAKDEAEDLQAAMDNITVEHFDADFSDEELSGFNDQIDEATVKTQSLEAATREAGDTINSAYDEQSILNWIDGFENSTAQANEFKSEISSLTSQLEEMESKGLYFGDEEYDDAFLKLEKVKRALKDYKKELTSPTPDALKIDTSTLEGQVQNLSETLYRLREQGKSLGNEEYDNTAQALKRAQDALADYKKELLMSDEQRQQAERLREIGESARVASPYIVKLAEELDFLKKRQAELQSAGVGIGYEEYDANAQKIAELNAKLKGYTSTTKKANKETTRFNDSLKKTNKAAVPLTKSVIRLGNMFRLMLIRMAMREVVNGAKEGFQNLAKYSEDTNVAISSLMSAMTQLKNAFATAFTPVLEVVSPILTKFIGLLAEAVTWVAQLFAALTGSDTFIKAIKVQEDYKKSLDDTAKSTENVANETEKTLAPFDELVQFQKTKIDSSSSSSGDTSALDMFTTEEVTNQVKEQADAIKNIFASLFEPLKQSWMENGPLVLEALKSTFSSFRALAGDVAASFMQVWDAEGYGKAITDNLIITFANFVTILGNLAERFRIAWNDADTGTNILRALGDIVLIITGFFRDASAEIMEWSKNIDFSPILKSFQSILNSLTPIISKITTYLLNFLKNVLLPLASWGVEQALPAVFNLIAASLDVLNSVLGALEPLAMWLWETFLQPLGKWTGEVIIEALQKITEKLKAFSDWISQHQTEVENVTVAVLAFFAAWKFTEFVNGIVSMLGKIPLLISNLTSLLGVINPLNVAIATIISLIAVLAKNWDAMSPTEKLISGILAAASAAAILAIALNAVGGAAKAALVAGAIVAGIGSATIAINAGKRQAASSGSSSIRGSRSAPVSSYSGLTYSMPRLATGTVVPPRAGEFAAILGDNNRDYEVVSPVETMKQAFKDAVTEMGGLSGNNQVAETDMIIDGYKFGKLVVKFGNQEKQRVGVTMVTEG